ncbi:hypothetical protein QR680_016165 [Steinernema hermaphroditum]|uniref:Uncharacterized protein n=1 Tax=Steinernema hermaphroditum TaxID=289476 RepID=A0AA39LLH9_9BILA|nr:hypothetical protein QR680_016165 [Steinernema hermaphroditum]
MSLSPCEYRACLRSCQLPRMLEALYSCASDLSCCLDENTFSRAILALEGDFHQEVDADLASLVPGACQFLLSAMTIENPTGTDVISDHFKALGTILDMLHENRTLKDELQKAESRSIAETTVREGLNKMLDHYVAKFDDLETQKKKVEEELHSLKEEFEEVGTKMLKKLKKRDKQIAELKESLAKSKDALLAETITKMTEKAMKEDVQQECDRMKERVQELEERVKELSAAIPVPDMDVPDSEEGDYFDGEEHVADDEQNDSISGRYWTLEHDDEEEYFDDYDDQLSLV